MSDAGNSPQDDIPTPSDEDSQTPEDPTAALDPEDVTIVEEPQNVTGSPGSADTSAPSGENEKRLRERVARGEETFGKLAQDLLEHPMVTGALSAMFETRERAARAQEVAMSALNLPSANDIERLTRRLRSVSQRLEGLEDGIDQVADRLERLGSLTDLHARLDAIEAALGRIEASLGTQDAEGTHDAQES